MWSSPAGTPASANDMYGDGDAASLCIGPGSHVVELARRRRNGLRPMSAAPPRSIEAGMPPLLYGRVLPPAVPGRISP